ncbi:inactive protein RESTRICTED TEV MOVEMENT 2-like [Melia azedarach]|uniref:Inactive protein RESTRICTED TEV MOVEMENT 2-like n=1 Tax=Melia azedarach TaxID=155640 RepID=A0ACC1YBP5_MELAZ|nr:inactive protein RESTRICTED TEV MOVEMENT 2-like [Melia azedarach]
MAMRARARPYLPRQPMLFTFEHFKPQSEWKYEDDATMLLLYLPGFVKEQIRAMFTLVDGMKLGIKVQGQRPLLGGRRSIFNETYLIPENCDFDKINSNFQRGVLTIVMPKAVEAIKDSEDEEKQETSATESSSDEEKQETSATEKQREEKDVEALSTKNVTAEEKSQKGQEEAASLVDEQKQIDEKKAASGGETASGKADEKSHKGEDEASPKTATLVDEKIDEKKEGSGGESVYKRTDGKSENGQAEASTKTSASVNTAEKIDEKIAGSGTGESAYQKEDGKSEKGPDEASPKTASLVDETSGKIEEKKERSGGERAHGKADDKKEKGEAIEKEKLEEAEKPESSAEKSKEISEAVAPKTEHRDKTIEKGDKSVNDLEEERKKDTIVGKSKDTKDESASAFAPASESLIGGKQLLLNMGTAMLVIMGLGAHIVFFSRC